MSLPQENKSVIEEAGLLARTGAGDHAAFRELYMRYATPLFSLAVRLVGDAGEAEELLQDSFVKIWRSAASYDSRLSRPFSWAVTIVRRTCFDRLRKRRRRPELSPLPADDILPEPAVPDPVRQRIEAAEVEERVVGTLAAISTRQGRALELALFSGMTHPEIARQLNEPVGTIKSWIRRGLLQLRANLNDTTR